MNDKEIIGLDEIQEQEYVYLVDNVNNKYKICKEIAIKVSGFIKESIEADNKNHDLTFIVKCEELTNRRLEIANPITVKKIQEWILFVEKNPPPFILKPIQLTSFKKIIKKYSKAINEKKKELESEWYSNWINIPPHSIFNILTAANYLQMDKYLDSESKEDENGLINICCVKIAASIKGKTPEEIKQTMEYKGPIDEINDKIDK